MNVRFGKESGLSALEATPQETDHKTGIPDALVFCIAGALGFPPFFSCCEIREFCITNDENCGLPPVRFGRQNGGLTQPLRLRLRVSDEGKLKTRGQRGVEYASEWPILLRRTLLLICPRGIECVDAKL